MSFEELCADADSACEVTMQPIRRYDMDAAILFTDLLTPVVPMGLGLHYDPGPILDRKIESMDDVRALEPFDPEVGLKPMLDTVRKVRAQLADDKALLGFVGAPFTMACYLIEGRGSKAWDNTRRMMFAEPALFDALLDRITTCLEPLVKALSAAGCDGVQVFDSWAGVLSADDYARRAAPGTQRLLRTAREADAIAINFVNGAAQHVETLAGLESDVTAVDWRLPMRKVREKLPSSMALQGNMDPALLFADEATLRSEVRRICEEAGREGHIFNLGHGITPKVDPQALAVVVDEVRKH